MAWALPAILQGELMRGDELQPSPHAPVVLCDLVEAFERL